MYSIRAYVLNTRNAPHPPFLLSHCNLKIHNGTLTAIHKANIKANILQMLNSIFRKCRMNNVQHTLPFKALKKKAR